MNENCYAFKGQASEAEPWEWAIMCTSGYRQHSFYKGTEPAWLSIGNRAQRLELKEYGVSFFFSVTKIQKIDIIPKSFLFNPSQSSQLPPIATTELPFVTVTLTVLARFSNKWNHRVCSYFCLASFAQDNFAKIHPYCCVINSSFFLLLEHYFIFEYTIICLSM